MKCHIAMTQGPCGVLHTRLGRLLQGATSPALCQIQGELLRQLGQRHLPAVKREGARECSLHSGCEWGGELRLWQIVGSDVARVRALHAALAGSVLLQRTVKTA